MADEKRNYPTTDAVILGTGVKEEVRLGLEVPSVKGPQVAAQDPTPEKRKESAEQPWNAAAAHEQAVRDDNAVVAPVADADNKPSEVSDTAPKDVAEVRTEKRGPGRPPHKG